MVFSCGIVISPRTEGIKLHCAHLTESGYQKVERLSKEAVSKKENVREQFLTSIANSDMKFYSQIPFGISADPYHVVDLRSSSEVTTQLTDFILSAQANDWGTFI